MSDNMEIVDLEKKIRKMEKKANSKKSKLEDLQKKLEKKKAENIRATCPVLYTIEAKPDDRRHCAHRVGYFTSEAEARRHIPSGGTSHDWDDGVEWSYTVDTVVTETLKEIPSNINTVPSNFPYTGW